MSDLGAGKISNQRVKELNEVFDAKPNFSSGDALGNFVSEYFLCEALANKFIEYCVADCTPTETKPKKKTDVHFKLLDIRNIKKALTHFAVNFSVADADAVFRGGCGKTGYRTARQLRNEYAHSLSLSARNEIVQRSVELLGLMSRFCMAVESRISERTSININEAQP